MEIISLNSAERESPSTNHLYTITAIRPAARVENRVNIYVNDQYDFSLDIAQVIDLHLKVGKHLSKQELDDCRHASEFGKLYQRTLEYVLTSPRSISETRKHLKERRFKREMQNRQAISNRQKSREEQRQYRLRTKEVPLYTDQDINAVINRLIEKGYLSDQKFAEYYVENRFIKKGISKKRLNEELKKKGIDQSIIENVLARTGRDEASEIKKIIARKSTKYSAEKLTAYLVRQGFDYQQVKALVREMDSQNSAQSLPW